MWQRRANRLIDCGDWASAFFKKSGTGLWIMAIKQVCICFFFLFLILFCADAVPYLSYYFLALSRTLEPVEKSSTKFCVGLRTELIALIPGCRGHTPSTVIWSRTVHRLLFSSSLLYFLYSYFSPSFSSFGESCWLPWFFLSFLVFVFR